MSRSALILLLSIVSAARGEDWVEFRMGPFEVVSSQGDRETKETLNYLEQFRFALGSQLGNPDLQSTWPIRVVLLGKRSAVSPALRFGRDSWVCSLHTITTDTSTSLAQVLLDSWPGGLPPPIRRGLITLYSTVQVQGTRVTLGTPPSQKDRDWTRAHMFAVDPNYSGKLRVLLGNLGKGVDPEVAYKNAFNSTAQDIERAVDRYMEAGRYETTMAASKPMSVRSFLGKPLDPKVATAALGDVALANEQLAAARDLYTKAGLTEGLGLVALKSGQTDEATKLLAGAQTARALYEYGRLAKDRTALTKAAAANERWAEPHKLLASMETHPAQKIAALRKVAQLEPQVAENWVQLATLQEQVNQLADAAKSWAAAERATDDPNEKNRIRQLRVAGENRRDEAVRAERDAARRKAEQEIEDLRQRALMNIRKAEAKANADKPIIDAGNLDEYKEDSGYKKTSGVLSRVDCLGIAARLYITSGRNVVRLLVPDPSKVAIRGGGELSFGCGVQKPARKVAIEFMPRKDAQQGTVGDAVTIEFQ